MMKDANNVWAVVLAAGSGTRLSTLTVTPDGAAVPKQFCSLTGATTLLEDALTRARPFVPAERSLCLVASEHQRWWQGLTSSLPAQSVMAQPRNRGTGIGIMLAVAEIARRDPGATVLLLPSDHFVRDEHVLGDAIGAALAQARRMPDCCVMLGITPEEADGELGYIVPRGHGRVQGVSRFVEKPSAAEATTLIAVGALWNSFILAGSAACLLAMCALHHHKPLYHLRRALISDANSPARRSALARIYAHLPEIDFSRHVVPGNEARLRVAAAATCGWTDLGTPRRVARCLEALGAHWLGAHERRTEDIPVNLAQACRRLGLAR